jgi:RNA polymerase sigma factor (sigma-70 family)
VWAPAACRREDEDVPDDAASLYQQHSLPAFRLALLLTAGETALAEDAVHDAFGKVFPRWAAGQVDDFGAYLRRAVANEVMRTFRRRRLERRLSADGGGCSDRQEPFEDRVGERDRLWRALGALPLKQRTAVVLHYYADLPVEAVAATMGTSVGTAKSHLSRGRQRLRELL